MRTFLALAILVALSGATRAEESDNSRFCSKDAPNVVVFLDVTTPYDDTDKATLVDGISKIFENLKDGAHLSMRTIEDVFSNSHRLLDFCMPYCPSEGFFADLLSKCTEGVVIDERKRGRERISATLLKAMEARSELPNSEIVRTLSLASAEEYAAERENLIYVFSDMIENSAYLSGADFFRKPNADLILKLADDHLVPDLMGANVRVFGVGRGGSATRAGLPQDRLSKLQDFWRLYFAAAGATVKLQQNFALPD